MIPTQQTTLKYRVLRPHLSLLKNLSVVVWIALDLTSCSATSNLVILRNFVSSTLCDSVFCILVEIDNKSNIISPQEPFKNSIIFVVNSHNYEVIELRFEPKPKTHFLLNHMIGNNSGV
jgi:hypothetical protein